MGDVWKIMPILARHRPDLELSVIDAAPSGMAVVRNLDPKNMVLSAGFKTIVGNMIDLTLDHAFLETRGIKRVPADETSIRTLLSG